MTDRGGESSVGRRSKVIRLIDKYSLEDIGGEMEQMWTSDNDRMSLRSLAVYFNQEILATVLADVGMNPFNDEVDTIYKLLTDDDVSSAEQTRIRRRLEREGVDVDELLGDFVTYQAIRTYLKDYRDAEYKPDDRDRAVAEAENIQRLRGRTKSVIESKLEQLQKNEELLLGDSQLFVDIKILCKDCGQQYKIDKLLDRGGCGCLAAEGG